MLAETSLTYLLAGGVLVVSTVHWLGVSLTIMSHIGWLTHLLAVHIILNP